MKKIGFKNEGRASSCRKEKRQVCELAAEIHAESGVLR